MKELELRGEDWSRFPEEQAFFETLTDVERATAIFIKIVAGHGEKLAKILKDIDPRLAAGIMLMSLELVRRLEKSGIASKEVN